MTDVYAHDAPEHLEHYELCCRAGTAWDFAVYISKVGGGTLGRRYIGYWHYVVVDYRRDSATWGQEIARGSNFSCGSLLTHREAADGIASFFEED